jgi:hypothetical protein
MKQYEFQITNKRTARVEHARATARTAEIARKQIEQYYGEQFDVAALYCDINPPHQVLGEIDCSNI